MLNNEYCKRVYEQILARDPDQKEFHQAVYEVLEGLEPMVERRPELEKNGILERFVEPERVVTFRVPWTDDAGHLQLKKWKLLRKDCMILFLWIFKCLL